MFLLVAERRELRGFGRDWEAAGANAPPHVDATPWEWVATPVHLEAVAAELEGESALAVDVEHHSQHSYLGFTCLVQLSTGTRFSCGLPGLSTCACLLGWHAPLSAPVSASFLTIPVSPPLPVCALVYVRACVHARAV